MTRTPPCRDKISPSCRQDPRRRATHRRAEHGPHHGIDAVERIVGRRPHRGLDDEQSALVNAKLILLLANHVGDLGALAGDVASTLFAIGLIGAAFLAASIWFEVTRA